MAARLFANLSQTRGREVCLSVMTFLDRIANMERGATPFEADGPAARDLLRRRGLTDARLAEARSLLDAITSLPPPRPAALVEAAELEQQAVDAMWAWYLEWSATVRATINNKTLLRLMGFSGRQPRAGEPDPSVEADDELVPCPPSLHATV